MTTFAVTGGAGAIGSRLMRHLLAKAATEKIFVYDDLSSGHRWLLPDDPRVEFREVDVADLRTLPEDLSAVFHFAAHFANQNSVDHPYEDLATNGLGTLRVLDAAARARKREGDMRDCRGENKRMIHMLQRAPHSFTPKDILEDSC